MAACSHNYGQIFSFCETVFNLIDTGRCSASGARPGLRSYRAICRDFAHLFIYAAFGYVLATRAGLFGGRTRPPPVGRRMLPVAAVFDLAENLFQVHLLGGLFGAEPGDSLSACCSAVKWSLAAGFSGDHRLAGAPKICPDRASVMVKQGSACVNSVSENPPRLSMPHRPRAIIQGCQQAVFLRAPRRFPESPSRRRWRGDPPPDVAGCAVGSGGRLL